MRILFVGCGNMGQALLRGFWPHAAGRHEVYVNDNEEEKARQFASELGLSGSVTLTAAADMDVLLLAVKPDIVPLVAEGLAGMLKASCLVISIAAGVSLAQLRARLPHNPLCRAMPNLAATVGQSCTALCFDGADAAQQQFAEQLFTSCGRSYLVEEKMFDAVVGVAGSSPAYLMLVVEALADGAVKMGLPRNLALDMAIQALAGSAALLRQSGLHPAIIKDQVCSPGGTTIAAVDVLERSKFRAALIAAVEAAARRNKELGAGQ